MKAWLAVGVALLWGTGGFAAAGVEVTGRVEMPATCAPEVSPAVVRLEPIGPSTTATPTAGSARPEIRIQQHGLRFEPRVIAVSAGQTVQFGNSDPEAHNIHIMAKGVNFNQSVPPGGTATFVPETPGCLTVLCDVHSHMRAFLVVGGSPWITACGRTGRFRLDDVPPGQYRLTVWHEMGDEVASTVTVGGDSLDLGAIAVTARPGSVATADNRPVEPWADVIDHIGMTLARSLDAAKRADGRDRAVTLAQDAYFAQFEASDMETATRAYLGFERSSKLESQFRELIRAVGNQPARAPELSRNLLVALVRAGEALNAKGITDRSKVLAASPAAADAPTSTGASRGELAARMAALDTAFGVVQGLADAGRPEAAAAALGDQGYFQAFEPIERVLNLNDPGTVRSLEARFNVLRGEINGGLLGAELSGKLKSLRSEIAAAVDRATAQTAGRFTIALTASFGTILREGLEIILILTMLGALVRKAGRTDLLPAFRWGIGLAIVASVLTAWGLHSVVAASAGRTREALEGGVLLVASGVLFYVSYWLISQSESQRWLGFLQRQAQTGASRGAAWALGLTAFLAFYREGAETALMYQSMLSMNQGARDGIAGLMIGLAAGLAVLAVLYVLIRATSIKLPLRAFFQITGYLLFAMAVVFAGHGVFELQSAQILRTTPVAWLGSGVPILGFYPNVQALAVQGILLGGAIIALALGLLLPVSEELPRPSPARPAPTQLGVRV